MDASLSRAPDWARVEEDLGYAKCPACGLFLPDEPDQRDKSCPKCLRDRGEMVLMRPTAPNVAAPPASAGELAA